MYNCNIGKEENSIPSKLRRELDHCKHVMGRSAVDAVLDKLNEVLARGEIHTSGWIPGSDWTSTAFQPIWIAARQLPRFCACFHAQSTPGVG
jgi:hypothetical protein